MSATTDQIITGVDFVGIPTHDLATAAQFYGETLGLHRSVYMPERNYSEFETGNLTLSIYDADKMGIGHNRSATRSRCTSTMSRPRGRRSSAEASHSAPTRWTPVSATWRSSRIRTATP